MNRPKIKLPLSAFDRKMERANYILLIILWALSIYAFIQLPEIIPIHFNAAGQPNNYGNKTTLMILPLIATGINFGITKLNNYPHIFNYMVTITEENAVEQYTNATRMLRYLKLAIVFIFILIILFTCLTGMGTIKSIGGWFLPVVIIIVLGPTVYAVTRAFKKK